MAKDGNLFGQTDVFLEGRRTSVRTQETNLGNLSADANLFAARALTGVTAIGISLRNGGGIRDGIGSFAVDGTLLPPAANSAVGKTMRDISQLDIENSLRFNNGLTVVSLSGTDGSPDRNSIVRSTQEVGGSNQRQMRSFADLGDRRGRLPFGAPAPKIISTRRDPLRKVRILQLHAQQNSHLRSGV